MARLQVVPVVFNVKNFDLFFIDRWNRDFRKDEHQNRTDWKDSGVSDPEPFKKPAFYAPQEKGLATPVPTGGAGVAWPAGICSLTSALNSLGPAMCVRSVRRQALRSPRPASTRVGRPACPGRPRRRCGARGSTCQADSPG